MATLNGDLVGARSFRRAFAVALGALAVLVAAPGAYAATCADFSTQAAAQTAANTRDADGDGVYCESLPCPCAGPGSTSHPAKPKPQPARLRLRTALLGKRTRRTGCRVRGALPDPRCTPGAVYLEALKPQLCASGWSAKVRAVSEATKNAVYASYGIRHHSRATYEIDHLVPLELGGSNDPANLFPEAANPKPGYHEKDEVENATRHLVCDYRWNLRATQRGLARNWLAYYKN